MWTNKVKPISLDSFGVRLMLVVPRSQNGPQSSGNCHIHCRKMEKKAAVSVISNLFIREKNVFQKFLYPQPQLPSTLVSLARTESRSCSELRQAGKAKSREIPIDLNMSSSSRAGFMPSQIRISSVTVKKRRKKDILQATMNIYPKQIQHMQPHL